MPESINVRLGNSDMPSLRFLPVRPEDRTLIIGLHKMGPSPAMEQCTQIDSKAYQEGFAVAHFSMGSLMRLER